MKKITVCGYPIGHGNNYIQVYIWDESRQLYKGFNEQEEEITITTEELNSIAAGEKDTEQYKYYIT